jgi:hypothetical protein
MAETKHSSDMVERVALAIRRAVEKATPLTWTEDGARAALEASHHAELVGELRWFVAHGQDLAMDVRSGHDARRADASEEMRREDYEFRLALSDRLTHSDRLLANLGGDA